jgi:hypothetical protein
LGQGNHVFSFSNRHSLQQQPLLTMVSPLSSRAKPRILNCLSPWTGAPCPEFPVRSSGSRKLHAPFLTERRTRGFVQGSLQEIRGVCAGVAGALHGLNKMGRSPFRCSASRAARPKNEDFSPASRTMRRDLQFRGPFLETRNLVLSQNCHLDRSGETCGFSSL